MKASDDIDEPRMFFSATGAARVNTALNRMYRFGRELYSSIANT